MKTIYLSLILVGLVMGSSRQSDIDDLVVLVQNAQGPAQLLVNHIDSLILQVRQEQLSHDDVYGYQEGQCDEELTYRNREYKQASEQFSKSSERKQQCFVAYTLTKADLSSANRYLQKFTEDTITEKQQRVLEATSTNSQIDNLQYILQTLEVAEGTVNDYSQGHASLIQMTRSFNKVILQGAKVGMASELGPIYALLAQVSQDDTPSDLVQRILSLIQTLKEKVQVALAELTEAENSSIYYYERRIARTEQLIEQLNPLIKHLGEYLKENELCLSQETDIINAANADKIRNKSVLDSANDLCNAFLNDQSSNTRDRKNEITSLEKLKNFVLTKAEAFGNIEGSGAVGLFSAHQSQIQDEDKSDDAFLQMTSNMRIKQ